MSEVFLTPEQSTMILKQAVKQTLKPELKKKDRTVTYWAAIYKNKKGEERLLADFVPNVIPNAFVDEAHVRLFTSASLSGSGFNFIALSADDTQAENASQTSLTGEITTNGLGRVQASVRTHTNGTNESTLEQTFTLTGTQTQIRKGALFNQLSGGIMGPWSPFTSGGPTGQMEDGETLKIVIIVATSTS